MGGTPRSDCETTLFLVADVGLLAIWKIFLTNSCSWFEVYLTSKRCNFIIFTRYDNTAQTIIQAKHVGFSSCPTCVKPVCYILTPLARHRRGSVENKESRNGSPIHDLPTYFCSLSCHLVLPSTSSHQYKYPSSPYCSLYIS